MTINLRTLLFVSLGFFFLLFLFFEKDILTPFVLAGIFAYIFNPLIDFFSQRIKLTRSLSVIIVYIAILLLLFVVGAYITAQISSEYQGLKTTIDTLLVNARAELRLLPVWLSPTAQDVIATIEKTKLANGQALFALFPEAISRLVSVFIFLFAGFYFLKEADSIEKKLQQMVSRSYVQELGELLQKIDSVFRNYLRGQLILVFVIAFILFIIFSILGVKSALILAVFSGFAEIVPLIGPVVAASVAALVVMIEGASNFSLSPLQAVLIVLIIYFVFRQILDYLVVPHVMGKITQLHPLLVFFAVIAGGHLGGVLGLLLAVPVAGTIRILVEFLIEKVDAKSVIHLR